MATSLRRKRSLVGRIKNLLRRKVVLKAAFAVFRVIYHVARILDLFR